MTATLVPMRVGAAELLLPDDERGNLAILYGQGVWYEADLLSAIKELQSGRGTFVDVGAGFGNHSVHFAVECGADRVIAVEPFPASYDILVANIARNELANVVEPHCALIHPTWETATLSGPDGADLPAAWSYSQQPILSEGGDTPCVTLDGLLAFDIVDVLKIDTEDTSIDVLRSGRATIARCRPIIAIEAAEAHEQEQVAETLAPLGYRLHGQFCHTPTFLWVPQ